MSWQQVKFKRMIHLFLQRIILLAAVKLRIYVPWIAYRLAYTIAHSQCELNNKQHQQNMYLGMCATSQTNLSAYNRPNIIHILHWMILFQQKSFTSATE